MPGAGAQPGVRAPHHTQPALPAHPHTLLRALLQATRTQDLTSALTSAFLSHTSWGSCLRHPESRQVSPLPCHPAGLHRLAWRTAASPPLPLGLCPQPAGRPLHRSRGGCHHGVPQHHPGWHMCLSPHPPLSGLQPQTRAPTPCPQLPLPVPYSCSPSAQDTVPSRSPPSGDLPAPSRGSSLTCALLGGDSLAALSQLEPGLC